MANSNEESERAANDRLIAVGAKWFCARNGVLKKRMERNLTDAMIVAMGERMARAQMTGEDLPWEADLYDAACCSEKLRERVLTVIRKHRRSEGDEG